MRVERRITARWMLVGMLVLLPGLIVHGQGGDDTFDVKILFPEDGQTLSVPLPSMYHSLDRLHPLARHPSFRVFAAIPIRP